MELRDYLTILWRRKWVILTTILVTEIVVILGTLMIVPQYKSSVLLRIAAASSGTVNYSDYMYADRLMNTYAKIATTQPVLDELSLRLKLSVLPKIEVEILPETELIQIKVEDRDPALAARIANTLAEILISQSMELYTGGGKSSQEILSEQLVKMEDEVNQARIEYMNLVAQNPDDTESIQSAKQSLDLKQEIYASMLEQYEQNRLKDAIREKSISIVEPAVPSSTPSSPRRELNIVLGLLVSMVGGLGLTFLFENLDSTLYSSEQIDALTQLPSLGRIPNVSRQAAQVSPNGNSPYYEAFRRIRTSVLALDQDGSLQTIAVTSSEPGEGKSTLVTNLALALAQSGKKVVVVDCDMRIPNVHLLFNLSNKVGLSNVLIQNVNPETVLQEINVPGVQVLTSGPKPRNPAELLGSSQMIAVIDQLRQHHDIVLLDTPCILGVTDATVLAPLVDGVILVVCRTRARRGEVQAAFKQLINIKAKIVGTVINYAEQDGTYNYYNRKSTPIKK